MKLRGVLSLALVLALACGSVLAQVNPGTSPLSIPKGGTGQSTAAAARQSSGLNVYGDAGTGHGDAGVTIGNTERFAYTNAAFTASRAWVLPAANVTGQPYTVKVADVAGGVTGANTLVVTRAGSDTINGGTTVTISAAYAGYECSSDGVSKWNCLAMGSVVTPGGTNVQTTNYQITTSDCAATVQYGTGTTGLLTATLPSVSGFSAGCTVTVKNGDTGRGKILSGFPSNVNYILPPLQALQVQVVNGVWTQIGNSVKWRLPGATPGANTYTFYVDGLGSDTTTDGMAVTTGAFASCQHAMDWVSQFVDANQQNVALQVNSAANCSTLNLKAVTGIYDFWPNSPLLLQGTFSPLLTWNCGAAYCIVGLNVQGWRVQGFAFNSSVGYIEADAGATIYIGTNSGTGNPPVGWSCINKSSLCELVGNWTNLNTAQTTFATIQNTGQFINAGSNTITWNNAVAYGGGVWSIADMSLANISGITNAGAGATTSTGSTFVLTRGSDLSTGGKCATTGGSGLNLVGNSAGTSGTFATGNCS